MAASAGFDGVAARIFEGHAVSLVGVVHGCGFLMDNLFGSWLGRLSASGSVGMDTGWAWSVWNGNLVVGGYGFRLGVVIRTGAADGYGADDQHSGEDERAGVLAPGFRTPGYGMSFFGGANGVAAGRIDVGHIDLGHWVASCRLAAL